MESGAVFLSTGVSEAVVSYLPVGQRYMRVNCQSDILSLPYTSVYVTYKQEYSTSPQDRVRKSLLMHFYHPFLRFFSEFASCPGNVPRSKIIRFRILHCFCHLILDVEQFLKLSLTFTTLTGVLITGRLSCGTCFLDSDSVSLAGTSQK